MHKKGIHVSFFEEETGMSRTTLLMALDELVSLRILSKKSIGRTGKAGRPIKYYMIENHSFVLHLLNALESLNTHIYGILWKKQAREIFILHTKEAKIIND